MRDVTILVAAAIVAGAYVLTNFAEKEELRTDPLNFEADNSHYQTVAVGGDAIVQTDTRTGEIRMCLPQRLQSDHPSYEEERPNFYLYCGPWNARANIQF